MSSGDRSASDSTAGGAGPASSETPSSGALGTEAIEQLIVDFILHELLADSVEELDRDESLFVGGLIDSVGVVRLVTHLQDTLGVTVPAPDLVPDNFRTVRVMAAYLGGLEAR